MLTPCQLKILKLEDWPPAESFKELPRHFLEFVGCLPFKHYSHPLAGYLDISTMILEMLLKPDLGPKTCFSYGGGEELGFDSVTNLQYALSDMLVHPVHEKAFYLTVEHKRNLKEEYGIEPWTFVQKLGDAVFVPAGCPHQIKNLKSCTSVAVNFVSPESVGECVRISTEYRRLPHNHSCKDDKLQVKKMTLYAIRQAVQYLDRIPLKYLYNSNYTTFSACGYTPEYSLAWGET